MNQKLWRTHTAAALLAGTALAFCGSAGAAPVDHNRLLNADNEPENWISVFQNYSSHNFSRLDEINRDNVANLRPVFTVPLTSALKADKTPGLQGGPLVDEGMMFITDGWGITRKIDVTAGDKGVVLWRTDPAVSTDETPRDRGLAFWGNNVYNDLVDGRVVAFDRDTGEIVWDQQVARTNITDDFYGKEQFTAAPLAAEGKILVGQSFGDAGTRGWLAALDPETGAELWRRYAVPGPGEPGHETWLDDHDAWKTGGGGMWTTGSYDPEQRLAIWGVGQPVPMFDPEYRPGDNLFTNSALAINIDTGEIEWYFQYTPNESWDFDENGVHMLIDVEIDGELRKTVNHFGRNGIFYQLDRTSGQFIQSSQFVDKVTWTAGIDPKTGKPLEYNPGLEVQVYLPETRVLRGEPEATICPNYHGGVRWQPSSYNGETRTIYAGISEGCFSHKIEPVIALPGGGIDADGPGGRSGRIGDAKFDRYGAVVAIDATTGQVKAKHNLPHDNLSGAVATAGGLVFSGQLDGTFTAFDADSLEPLWTFNTGISFKAPPITYAVGGKQYVAIIAGGEAAPYVARGFDGDPVLQNMETGAMLYVFSL
jgi:alcohol dehydrogenase (cytochrome c)